MSPPGTAPPTQTILVVDDEPDVLFSLAALFTEAVPGAWVLTAGNGQESVDLLKDVVPDLVISDFHLPDMTGLEVLARSRAVAPEVTRVLITAAPDRGAVERAIREGTVDRFIAKPWDAEQLVASVRAILDHHAASQKHAGPL